MIQVEPEVFLVAKPEVDLDELDVYVESVGRKGWQDHVWENFSATSGEDLVEAAGRLCYRSWDVGLNPNVKQVRTDSKEYFTNILKSGHGSVLEHANYSFIFHNVSRVFTHELVRHRAGAAYSQESMRFVRLTEIPFWFPDWAKADAELMSRCTDLLLAMEKHQEWMAQHFGLDADGVPFHEKKAKTSFMRRFAPDGVATGILFTANIRALRHTITMRTDPAAEEEIRLVFGKVAEIMQQECPLLFGDFTKTENGQWVPAYRKV